MSVASILQQMAENAARSRFERGAILGQTVAGLARVPGQYLADRDRARLEAEQLGRERETYAMRLRGDQRAESGELAQQQKEHVLREAIAVGFGDNPDPKAFDVQRAGEVVIARGFPELVTTIGEIHTKLSPPPKAPIVMNPGDVGFDPTTRAPIPGMSVAPKPEPLPKPPAVGTFEDYVLRGATALGKPADRLTQAEIEGFRKRYQQADDRPITVTTGDKEPLEYIIGPDGKAVLVPRSQAIGKQRASGAQKPASGVEKRALNFFNRAQQADVDLEGLEPQIAELSLGGQTYMSWAPNFMQTQLGQSYFAAQRAFTEARLRKDSGAAIPVEEFESDRKTYFVQPGDSKETIAQKRRGRAAMLASLAFESGQALGEFVGDPDEAKALVEKYKTRAAARSTQGGAAMRRPIPGVPGAIAESTDGGKTWKRVQ